MMETEPVLVLLAGLAVVVNTILGALVALDVIDWDGGQITAIVAAVTAVSLLVAAVVRASVYSPATTKALVAEAGGEITPGGL